MAPVPSQGAAFLWVKTIIGARTSGFFALQTDDALYDKSGSLLQPPWGSVMLSGAEFLSQVQNSNPLGIYATVWRKDREDLLELCTMKNATAVFHDVDAIFHLIGEKSPLRCRKMNNNTVRKTEAEKETEMAATIRCFKGVVSAEIGKMRSNAVSIQARTRIAHVSHPPT